MIISKIKISKLTEKDRKKINISEEALYRVTYEGSSSPGWESGGTLGYIEKLYSPTFIDDKATVMSVSTLLTFIPAPLSGAKKFFTHSAKEMVLALKLIYKTENIETDA
jgi:hypothetical protein